MTHHRLALLALALASCKSRDEAAEHAPTAPAEIARDAGAPADAATAPWPELEGLARAAPLRVITLPSRPDVPRFDVGGPAMLGDLAVVSSSQLGFAAVDWRRGGIAWTRPAGAHVAPPVATADAVILIGACVTPPEVPADHALLGCLRVVTAAGADQAYVAIHGRGLDAFAGAAGPQQVWLDGDAAVRWRRGDEAVRVELATGVATPTPAVAPPVTVAYQDRRWDIAQVDGKLVATHGTGPKAGKVAWRTDNEITSLLGPVWMPGQSPLVRFATITSPGTSVGGTPEVRLLDLDATGSMNGTAAWTPVPGIALLGQAISPVGDVALAIRLDRSIKRDFIAAYAANALLIYVYPLPVVARPDPVGVGIALAADRAPEAVVVFHDGDLVTVLPPLSAPPTAPGAARAPLENATP